MILDLKELKKIIRIFQNTELSELEIEGKGIKVRMKKGASKEISLPVSEKSNEKVSIKEVSKEKEEKLYKISSPMVGVFYRAPSPEASPFVEEGDTVDKEDVVCIIEAMKIMNEIKAEVKGKIKKILVENGEPVEYGQPLFLVEPLP